MKVEYINGVPRIKPAWRPRFSFKTFLLLTGVTSLPLYWYSRPEEHWHVHENAIVCWREFGLLGSQKAARSVIFLPENCFPRIGDCWECPNFVGRCLQDAKRDQHLHSDHVLWQATSEGISHIEHEGAMSPSRLSRYLATTPQGKRTAKGFAQFCEELRGDIPD
ncbi:hypothetical protein KOR34_14020 [Posidoniimonas corsicana]|uniref:Uncharacterized protein n=1 Tax=Posidoniimonas corsicana TaxID=1938618 RepID=A0A5C5VD24_9BACT|nr:hypothetical protein KOR34_14020 [Posidoniimonas corsicana]